MRSDEASGLRPLGRLPSTQRIRRRAEFKTIQSGGRRVRTAHFVILVYARESVDAHAQPRLGIVASRKVGNAVQRNRAKRLTREAFRATRALWPSGIDVVVIVKSCSGLKLADVIGEWVRLDEALRTQCDRARADRTKREAPSSPHET